MKLADAINKITSNNDVTMEREEGAWVARYSSNRHIIRRFTSGYDVVHCAQYMTEKNVMAKDAVKGDEYSQWWDERQTSNNKVGGACHKMWYKARLDLVEELLSLNTYDEVKDKLMSVRDECSIKLMYAGGIENEGIN